MTVDDAAEVLLLFKNKLESVWSRGWELDSASSPVQFVGFFDDNGALGTTGAMLRVVTRDNITLTAISIALIALLSIIFFVKCDCIQSRSGIALIGMMLVIIAYFGAIGLSILIGIKLSISIAWTLPFIVIGLGKNASYSNHRSSFFV